MIETSPGGAMVGKGAAGVQQNADGSISFHTGPGGSIDFYPGQNGMNFYVKK